MLQRQFWEFIYWPKISQPKIIDFSNPEIEKPDLNKLNQIMDYLIILRNFSLYWKYKHGQLISEISNQQVQFSRSLLNNLQLIKWILFFFGMHIYYLKYMRIYDLKYYKIDQIFVILVFIWTLYHKLLSL